VETTLVTSIATAKGVTLITSATKATNTK
jgi:hypothetical protein